MTHQPALIPSQAPLLTKLKPLDTTWQPQFHLHKLPKAKGLHPLTHQLLVEILDTLLKLLILRLTSAFPSFLEDLPRQREKGRMSH